MSKNHLVSWAAAAQDDLQQIIDYIAIDSPGNAAQILKKIKQKVPGLYAMTDRGRIVPELKEQGIHIYREMIIDPWRVICRISDSVVFVLSVIDSRSLSGYSIFFSDQGIFKNQAQPYG